MVALDDLNELIFAAVADDDDDDDDENVNLIAFLNDKRNKNISEKNEWLRFNKKKPSKGNDDF